MLGAGELSVNSFVTGTEKMSLCVSQAVEAADFMMHHQPHKQQCGRNREGEKEMGGVEEARQSGSYKELLRKEMMNEMEKY